MKAFAKSAFAAAALVGATFLPSLAGAQTAPGTPGLTQTQSIKDRAATRFANFADRYFNLASRTNTPTFNAILDATRNIDPRLASMLESQNDKLKILHSKPNWNGSIQSLPADEKIIVARNVAEMITSYTPSIAAKTQRADVKLILDWAIYESKEFQRMMQDRPAPASALPDAYPTPIGGPAAAPVVQQPGMAAPLRVITADPLAAYAPPPGSPITAPFDPFAGTFEPSRQAAFEFIGNQVAQMDPNLGAQLKDDVAKSVKMARLAAQMDGGRMQYQTFANKDVRLMFSLTSKAAIDIMNSPAYAQAKAVAARNLGNQNFDQMFTDIAKEGAQRGITIKEYKSLPSPVSQPRIPGRSY